MGRLLEDEGHWWSSSERLAIKLTLLLANEDTGCFSSYLRRVLSLPFL